MTTSDPILAALDQQVECYRRLAKLADVQHEYVQQSRVEDLLDVLARRQDVLNEIARLEGVIAATKQQWGRYVDGLDARRRERAESLMAETRRLLEEITAADRNDAMVLQQQRISVARQMNATTTAKTVNRSYAASAYGAPRAPRMDLTK